MKTFSASILAISTIAGCSAETSDSASSAAASTTTAAPTAATIAPDAALARMRTSVPADGTAGQPDRTLFVRATSLPADLAARFDTAKASLEDFAFDHSDQGDVDSDVVCVLSARGASTFVGYAVYAYGGDDSDRYASGAVEYYTADGHILAIDSRSNGLSDSEDAGDWSNVDRKLVAAQEDTLRRAFTFDAAEATVKLDQTKTVKADRASLPFASLVTTLQDELERSTWAHSDMGDDATFFVSVKGADGQIAGYILAAEGDDDSDQWFAAGYALFSAEGQLLGREIASTGIADTMADDAVLLYVK